MRKGAVSGNGNITASGGETTFPSTTLDDVTLSSAGAVRLVADGLEVSNSRLSGEAGLALLGNTGAAAGAPVSVSNSILNADGAGAVLRIDATSGTAGTQGMSGYNAGQGVTVRTRHRVPDGVAAVAPELPGLPAIELRMIAAASPSPAVADLRDALERALREALSRATHRPW